MRFCVVTLGCPKNQVDSEGLSRVMIEAGHEPVASPREAEVVIVNTCGFIEAARQESLEVLREMASLKMPRPRSGRVRPGPSRSPETSIGGKMLIAAGCLGERQGQQLIEEIGEIDAVLGTRRWPDIAQVVERARLGEVVCWTGPGAEPSPIAEYAGGRFTGMPSAYVKIADGCDAGCTFCAIPGIKGPYRSRPLESVVGEVRQLVDGGTKEVILIAQDMTAYGRDLGLRDGLAVLLDQVVERVPELPWLRILYAYPQFITPRLLETMARHRQVVKYIDLPLQHAHPAVLKRMGRPHGDPRAVVERLRSALPGVALRTTYIVGFPGETEEEFRDLLGFMREVRFDRVGIFTYSPEDGTVAATLPDQVPERIKRRRYDRAMRLQQEISLDLNRRWIGQTLDVLIEGQVEVDGGESAGVLGDWIGRSFRDAPEIDGMVFVRGQAEPGSIVTVRVTDALEYDLVGDIVVGAMDESSSSARS